MTLIIGVLLVLALIGCALAVGFLAWLVWVDLREQHR